MKSIKLVYLTNEQLERLVNYANEHQDVPSITIVSEFLEILFQDEENL